MVWWNDQRQKGPYEKKWHPMMVKNTINKSYTDTVGKDTADHFNFAFTKNGTIPVFVSKRNTMIWN